MFYQTNEFRVSPSKICIWATSHSCNHLCIFHLYAKACFHFTPYSHQHHLGNREFLTFDVCLWQIPNVSMPSYDKFPLKFTSWMDSTVFHFPFFFPLAVHKFRSSSAVPRGTLGLHNLPVTLGGNPLVWPPGVVPSLWSEQWKAESARLSGCRSFFPSHASLSPASTITSVLDRCQPSVNLRPSPVWRPPYVSCFNRFTLQRWNCSPSKHIISQLFEPPHQVSKEATGAFCS